MNPYNIEKPMFHEQVLNNNATICFWASYMFPVGASSEILESGPAKELCTVYTSEIELLK